MGVTTKKKIIPITIGEIIFPKSKPNVNQILFNGFNSFELINPNTKKIIEIIKDQTLIFSPCNNGYSEIIIKTKKNTIPKLLLVPILMSSWFMKLIYRIWLD